MTLQRAQQNTSNHSLSHRNPSVFVQQYSRSNVLPRGRFKTKHKCVREREEVQNSKGKDHMARVWYSQFGQHTNPNSIRLFSNQVGTKSPSNLWPSGFMGWK